MTSVSVVETSLTTRGERFDFPETVPSSRTRRTPDVVSGLPRNERRSAATRFATQSRRAVEDRSRRRVANARHYHTRVRRVERTFTFPAPHTPPSTVMASRALSPSSVTALRARVRTSPRARPAVPVAASQSGTKTRASSVVTPGRQFASLADAVNAGLVRGCAPFPDGIDLLGFFEDIKQTEAQRYADVEITHGRVAMLAALGFLVGEQVEGSSFLFDAKITGPAIDHFQQVPGIAWGLIGAGIFIVEASRIQIAWQDPFEASELFLLESDHVPGDYGFDPLGLAKGKDQAWLDDAKMKELNNGRVAMIAISGMVAQELVRRVNLLPADYVAGVGGPEALQQLQESCADAADEAACARAFAAAEKAAVLSDISSAAVDAFASAGT